MLAPSKAAFYTNALTGSWQLNGIGRKWAELLLRGRHCPELSGIMVIYVYLHTCSLPRLSQSLSTASLQGEETVGGVGNERKETALVHSSSAKLHLPSFA